MSGADVSERQKTGAAGATHLYCLGTLVADEAARGGFHDFAHALEAALGNFLSRLPREEQAEALRRSYELALCGEDPSPPRLRLVHSRD